LPPPRRWNAPSRRAGSIGGGAVTRLRNLLADAESRRLRGHVESAGSGTPRAPSLSGSVLGLSNRAAVQLAAQLLRPGAHILQFVESAPAA
jgi:hypothetical protein